MAVGVVYYTLIKYINFLSFPASGVADTVYIDASNSKGYLWDGFANKYQFIQSFNEYTTPAPVISPPFLPEKTAVSGSSSGAWVVRSLGAFYANKIIQIRLSKNAPQSCTAGVRRVGSVLDLSFDFGRGNSLFQVLANGSGDIEIKSNRANLEFWITGTK